MGKPPCQGPKHWKAVGMGFAWETEENRLIPVCVSVCCWLELVVTSLSSTLGFYGTFGVGSKPAAARYQRCPLGNGEMSRQVTQQTVPGVHSFLCAHCWSLSWQDIRANILGQNAWSGHV